jgi:DNA-3-methyladenine glycosylase I
VSRPRQRCAWALSDPLLLAYHDEEWGVPVHDDHRLFEMLTLEGAQAGLSWLIVLRRRAAYREAFAGFDPERIATWGKRELRSLVKNAGLIRHPGKLASVLSNARALTELIASAGSFDRYLWDRAGGKPLRNRWAAGASLPSETPASRELSRDLRKRGFSFVGPVVCYSFMQAVGLVDDHVATCFRSRRLTRT